MKRTDLCKIDYPIGVSKSDRSFVRGMINHVRDFVIAKNLTKVVIAYSAGVDSTVLVNICKNVRTIMGRNEFFAAHVKHGLRPEENKQEIELVKKAPIPFMILDGQVSNGSNLEARAREVRYKALCNAAIEKEAALFVAHNKDEDIETMLMRLFDNRYLVVDSQRVLYGIRPHSIINGVDVYRPLLSFSKNDLIRYAKIFNLEWVEDSSNKSCNFRRNFFRNKIVPEVSNFYNKRG